MVKTIGPLGPVEPRNVTMYGKQWATVEAYAKDEGYPVSMALRKIVDEWADLKRRQPYGQGDDWIIPYDTGEPS